MTKMREDDMVSHYVPVDHKGDELVHFVVEIKDTAALCGKNPTNPLTSEPMSWRRVKTSSRSKYCGVCVIKRRQAFVAQKHREAVL